MGIEYIAKYCWSKCLNRQKEKAFYIYVTEILRGIVGAEVSYFEITEKPPKQAIDPMKDRARLLAKFD